MPFYPFWGEGSPTKIDYRKKKVGTLILTSLLGPSCGCTSCFFFFLLGHQVPPTCADFHRSDEEQKIKRLHLRVLAVRLRDAQETLSFRRKFRGGKRRVCPYGASPVCSWQAVVCLCSFCPLFFWYGATTNKAVCYYTRGGEGMTTLGFKVPDPLV